MKKLINSRIIFNFVILQVLQNLVYGLTYKDYIYIDFDITVQIIEKSLVSNNFSIDSPTFYLIPSLLRITNQDIYLLFIYIFSQLIIYLICVHIDFLGNISSLFLFSGWVVTISWFMGYPDVVSILLVILIMKNILHKKISLSTFIWILFLVINHYALAVFLLIIVLILVHNDLKIKFTIYSISGFAIGRFLVQIYLNYIEFNGRTRLRFIFNDGVLETAVTLASNNLIYLIISGTLGLTILFFIFSYFEKFYYNRNLYIAYLIALIGTALSLDSSRIFSILVLPIIIFMLYRFQDIVKLEIKTQNLLYFVIAITSIFIGENHVYGSIYFNSPNSTEPSIYNLITNLINSLMKNIWP
jgi:hypothetical protein